MTRRLSEHRLAELARLIAAETGLHFGPERQADLERGLHAAARTFGLSDTACAERLLAAPPSKATFDVLVQQLTVGETYFFRDRQSFENLAREILPALVAARRADGQRRLRIWSAGCCTGEEAYSVAILLTQVLPDWQDWQLTVLGTDINGRFLQQAAAGVFSAWSFREAPPWLRDGYFRPVGAERYQILPHLRELVPVRK